MKYNIKFLTFIFSVVLFISCGEEKKETIKLLRPVKYQTVGFFGGDKVRSFSGTSRTDKIIKLSFRSSGIITKFNIKIGQKVRKGQQLATLDNVQARLNYQSALSSLNSAESAMNTAKLSLERTRKLFEKGSTALSNYESAKNSYNSAKNSYNSAKQSVALQQEQIRFGYLVVPENGIISSVEAEIDENVSPGQTIATLNAGTDMEIFLGLPESVINDVTQNMLVDVSFSSLQGKVFKGKVTEISPALDSNTATYPIRVALTNPSDEVKSGMAANVIFHFESAKKTTAKELVVPANAVGEDSNGKFVFLITEDGKNAKVNKQLVTIGDLTPDGFIIKTGLSEGQKIATAGLQTLLNGQEVKLQ
ncbi:MULTISPECIES: efflux RND transporter periplasmic adaptor subunit [unclassified Tenacibaculum]|uniref:efflux RND transporter periplasmic adaptor subunit n=1 Tax=unclassified Tenacibaculum TaxID=2635139 RepID=UPI001F3A838C|nr:MULTISPECIES: efflux RND transporter periplasmic adaptor subunit [unclassified Tenacibaculum]MCF2874724.1 efflux RND transporter periplasmic adaptor subunit [Tenacibaculum sp. Cn5-1]MCF2934210.1 efflux RND transporter periplasmic adaptor subunit [Tenacibaculum sp. Cn5-34]MCG7510420.1 efflux RND transporter periplasmic adaptor subunit [Tenacibaculum sp. Cn5-46]